MDQGDAVLGNNSIEDVEWLCSLSESELDMLVSLKMLAIQRAKAIGHNELANKFDLKMLRALGFILLKYVKEKVKDLPLGPSSSNPAMVIDNCNLLNSKVENIRSIEELKAYFVSNSRKKPPHRCEDGGPQEDATQPHASLKRKRCRNINKLVLLCECVSCSSIRCAYFIGMHLFEDEQNWSFKPDATEPLMRTN